MNDVQYVLKLNDKEVSPRVATPELASHYITNLTMSEQLIVEVVPITLDGKQVLMG